MNEMRFLESPGLGDIAIIFMKTFLTFLQREPAVVDVADVAAGDDIAVKETVSTSLVYPKDAVSGLYVDAAKLATPAMSDLSYVIYEGPENLEKNKKDSDVAR